jgi:hypothetical protein
MRLTLRPLAHLGMSAGQRASFVACFFFVVVAAAAIVFCLCHTEAHVWRPCVEALCGGLVWKPMEALWRPCVQAHVWRPCVEALCGSPWRPCGGLVWKPMEALWGPCVEAHGGLVGGLVWKHMCGGLVMKGSTLSLVAAVAGALLVITLYWDSRCWVRQPGHVQGCGARSALWGAGQLAHRLCARWWITQF